MRHIEIRLQEGLLLLGSPGMFPGILRKSSDDKLLASALRKLTANPPAMAHLRRNWLELGQRVPIVNLDDHDLLALMRREVSRGRLCAAMLGSRRRSAEVPELEEPAAVPVIHLNHDGKTILIASKGQLPHEFIAHRNNAHAAEILRKVPHASPAARAIDSQASRLPGGTVKTSSGPQLREHIAWQLERGSHEAVVLEHPQMLQKAAQLPSAPRPVNQWSLIEKIREALRLSITHLPAELVNAAVVTLIMELGIAIGTLIAAQFVPGGGEVVDAFVAAVVYRIAGVAGLIAFWQIAHATYIAANANTEVELDEAGQEYAAGFVAIGLAKLAEIRAKLLEGKLGGAGKEAGGTGGGKSNEKGGERTRDSDNPGPKAKEEAAAKMAAAAIAKDREMISKLVSEGKIDEAREILKPLIEKKDIQGIIDRLDVSAPKDGGFLWSGNKKAAASYAAENGGVVLETTPGGKVLDDWPFLNEKLPWNEGGEKLWGGISKKYANGLEGKVITVQSPEKAGGGYVFKNYEEPEIQKALLNGKVTDFEQRVVLPNETKP